MILPRISTRTFDGCGLCASARMPSFHPRLCVIGKNFTRPGHAAATHIRVKTPRPFIRHAKTTARSRRKHQQGLAATDGPQQARTLRRTDGYRSPPPACATPWTPHHRSLPTSTSATPASSGRSTHGRKPSRMSPGWASITCWSARSGPRASPASRATWPISGGRPSRSTRAQARSKPSRGSRSSRKATGCACCSKSCPIASRARTRCAPSIRTGTSSARTTTR